MNKTHIPNGAESLVQWSYNINLVAFVDAIRDSNRDVLLILWPSFSLMMDYSSKLIMLNHFSTVWIIQDFCQLHMCIFLSWCFSFKILKND